MDYKFTSNMETKLDKVADGELKILNLLNENKTCYFDQVFMEAFLYPTEIQNWVKSNLPRTYSNRHIQDPVNF